MKKLFARRPRSLARALMGLVLFSLLFGSSGTGQAQEATPDGPVYVVQQGDYLWDIALRFNVSMAELMNANGITDGNQLAVGARLIIPGLEGVQGELVTEKIGFGETLLSLSRRYNVSQDVLIRLNHLTSPVELYAGATLIIPTTSAGAGNPTRREPLQSGQSLLELAAANGANPWALVAANELASPWRALPGDVLRLPGTSLVAIPTPAEDETPPREPSALPDIVSSVSLSPSPFVQGKAAVIRIAGQEGMTLSGSLAGRKLNFFTQPGGSYISLQGLHAMQEPGLYSLTIDFRQPDGRSFQFSQGVFVKAGDYLIDPVLTVSPETIDPAVTQPEDAEWYALVEPVTPEKLWDGEFKAPVDDLYKDCFPSIFGSRRSYNGSDYSYFHTGLDFCGGVGNSIYAPAAGTVVFAGPLNVRGNATMIDHGWGVYTGYMHQSEILVNPGDRVEAGQEIGKVGRTGRVTGPHLHWEIFVGSVQVDPMDWLSEVFP